MKPISRPRVKRLQIFLAAFLLSSSLLFAGKPWRPAVEKLVPEAELIVIATVTNLAPSLITDDEKHRYDIAEVRIAETLKGTAPTFLRVAVQVEPPYDEKGSPSIRSSAWRYELERGGHLYLLFLAKPPIAAACYYVPVHFGSGIVDLNSERSGDGPQELQRLRDYLRQTTP